MTSILSLREETIDSPANPMRTGKMHSTEPDFLQPSQGFSSSALKVPSTVAGQWSVPSPKCFQDVVFCEQGSHGWEMSGPVIFQDGSFPEGQQLLCTDWTRCTDYRTCSKDACPQGHGQRCPSCLESPSTARGPQYDDVYLYNTGCRLLLHTRPGFKLRQEHAPPWSLFEL